MPPQRFDTAAQAFPAPWGGILSGKAGQNSWVQGRGDGLGDSGIWSAGAGWFVSGRRRRAVQPGNGGTVFPFTSRRG
jgi:hypothetical protein